MEDYAKELACVEAQLREMEKVAISGAVRGATRGLAKWYRGLAAPSQAWAGRGVGAGVGALGGGAAGAATAEEGGRVRGALGGALAGGAVGFGAGQLATGAGRAQVSRFGKRQLHGVTGWMPGQRGKGDFLGKGLSKKERVKRLKEIGMTVPEATSPAAAQAAAYKAMHEPGMVMPRKATSYLPESAKQRLAALRGRAQVSQRELAERGMTSIPGVVRGFAKDPRAALRASVRAPGALGVGLGLTAGVPQVVEGVRERDPRMIGGALAETAGYTLTGGLPIVPAMVAGGLARRVGELPGAAVQAIRRRGNQPPREA